MKLIKLQRRVLPGQTVVVVNADVADQAVAIYANKRELEILADMLPDERRNHVVMRILEDYVKSNLFPRPVGVVQGTWDMMSDTEKAILLQQIKDGKR
jgi:hypothetical protein